MKENRPLRVRGIDHVLVVSSDLDKTREFYLGLLGMDELPRPDFSFPGLWFQAGDTQVHVTLAGDDAGACGPGEFTGRYPAQGHHIAFQIDDAAAAAEHVRSLDIPIVAGPYLRPDGPLQFYIRDPDGYLIELFSR
ncbi:MAG: VOC family protein [Planctomycetota bacterium]|nr:VOC family protein [Planctomycetota bacterium]MEC9350189.1 VOC family protein [Planctomycetota bacterium]|tara:strand:- start:132 stop:539 length:408 start_codon:yes stop_codon:yes gene_type:complete